jgi:hypothetical protein
LTTLTHKAADTQINNSKLFLTMKAHLYLLFVSVATEAVAQINKSVHFVFNDEGATISGLYTPAFQHSVTVCRK